MTSPSALATWAVEGHAFAWGLALPPLVLGATLAVFLVGGPDRLRRAGMAAGPVLLVVAVALAAPRLVQALHPSIGGGPQLWWVHLVRLLPWAWLGASPPDGPIHPYDTSILVHAIVGALAGVALPLAALGLRLGDRPPTRPLPFSASLGVILTVFAVLAPWLASRALDQPIVVPGLEWMAASPILALLLAARLNASWTARTPGTNVGDRPAPTPAAADVHGAWVRAGVLDAGAEPLFRLPLDDRPTQPARVTVERSERAWAATGATGTPPGALDELLAEHAPAIWLVGDLPDHAMTTLLGAFLADRVGVGGHRVLVVCERPVWVEEVVSAALRRVHAWSPGAVTVGAASLKEAVTRSRLPAVAAVNIEDLARVLAPWARQEGAAWAASLSWMVACQPDRGGPLTTTYTAMAWRRWGMATRGLPTTSVLVFAADTNPVQRYLQVLFAGRPIERCPLRPRSFGSVVVWPATTSTSTPADPWTARAIRAAEALGVSSPHHEGGPDLFGPASVADLDAEDLPNAWRVAHHRLSDPAASTHHALWHVRPTPLAAYLTVPGRLAALSERRELPAPRPVVGLENRFVRLAWLRAALQDGLGDLAALRATFGDDVVDFATRDAEPSGAWVARVEGERVVRSPVLRGSPGAAVPDLHREALTTQVVEVVDRLSGERLATVDRALCPTRYHPKRVFQAEGRRWRVPLHALDEARARLLVEPADGNDALTRPSVRVHLEVRSVLVDRVTRRQGALEISTLTVDATVTEKVAQAWVPGRDLVERFDPVRSRYDTSVRLLHLDGSEPGPALGHLAGLLASLLPAHLDLEPDDFEIVAVGQGLVPGFGAGLAVVDRHLGGLGISSALDDGTLIDLLRWARAVTRACPCESGCVRCTPETVLRNLPDKPGLLRWLPLG